MYRWVKHLYVGFFGFFLGTMGIYYEDILFWISIVPFLVFVHYLSYKVYTE